MKGKRKWITIAAIIWLAVLSAIAFAVYNDKPEPKPAVKEVLNYVSKEDRQRAANEPVPILALKHTEKGYATPGGKLKAKIPPRWHGGESRLPVIENKQVDDVLWLKVMLQDRPNGDTAWVKYDPKRGMKTYRGVDVIDVNLRTKTLRWYHKGRMHMKTQVGIGVDSAPTPKGRFFITHLGATSSSSYGPFMLVTSAHSETIRDYGGIDDAIVAIHGPVGISDETIGKGARLSHGCIRMKIRDLKQLRRVAPGSLLIIH